MHIFMYYFIHHRGVKNQRKRSQMIEIFLTFNKVTVYSIQNSTYFYSCILNAGLDLQRQKHVKRMWFWRCGVKLIRSQTPSLLGYSTQPHLWTYIMQFISDLVSPLSQEPCVIKYTWLKIYINDINNHMVNNCCKWLKPTVNLLTLFICLELSLTLFRTEECFKKLNYF